MNTGVLFQNSDKKTTHTHHCFLGRCPFSGFASALWLMLAQCPRPWDRELQQMLLDGIDAGLSLWFAVVSACIFLKQNRDFLKFKNVYIYTYDLPMSHVVSWCFILRLFSGCMISTDCFVPHAGSSAVRCRVQTCCCWTASRKKHVQKLK